MKFAVLALVGAAGLAQVAVAQITAVNGIRQELRGFNQVPTSTINATNSFPGIVEVAETMPANETGEFAQNRHLSFLSTDNGVTSYELQNNESFQISFDFRIGATVGRPSSNPGRIEGGIWFQNPRVGGDGNPFVDEGGVWVIDNGVSFVGGANQSFYLVGNNVYTVGQTIRMTYRYFAPGQTPESADGWARYEVIYNGASSGIREFDRNGTDANGFNNGTRISFRHQHTPSLLGEGTFSTTYSNIQVVPAPASLALLGLAGTASRRRRG
ncbi:MAG: hypothetical protein SFZ23_06115 [Planctomycetota bacterium]|nr:hypothetical protein [Planctomycetota bacterium]